MRDPLCQVGVKHEPWYAFVIAQERGWMLQDCTKWIESGNGFVARDW